MNTLTINKSIYPVLSLPKRPKALLDRTVAKIYNVETRIINQAVSNNPEKFPKDFCFRLSKDEFQMIKKNSQSNWGKHCPNAFTWEGCNMLATILRSENAVKRSIEIVRAFTSNQRTDNTPEINQILQLLSSQSLMIATLAEEVTKNRTKIENHEKNIHLISKQLTFFEALPQDEKQEKITNEEAFILKKIVSRKYSKRKEIMRTWAKFHYIFDVAKYSLLPKKHLEKAKRWLEQL